LAIEAVESRSQGIEVDAAHQACSQQQVDGLPAGDHFTDIHTHVLWGLDDGPRTVDESIALCRALVEQGVSAVAATCHQRGVFARNEPPIIRQRAAELQEILLSENVPLAIRPSAEWMIDAQTAERLDSLLPTLLTLADRQKHALLEFPFQLPSYLPMVLQSLAEHGLVGVLAHIEKYHQLLANSARVEALVNEGFIMQINADSIAGKFGPGVMNGCRRLIQRGLVHLVASDAHSADRRPPMLKVAYENVLRWAGNETATLLFKQNPRAIFHGSEVARPKGMGWLARFRRR
jgi:protein-tyrosine phosphatase